MPFQKQIAEIELKIETIRSRLEALRARHASRSERERALAELARMKAERSRLMMRQVNLGGGRIHAAAESGPDDRAASTARPGSADG